MCGIYRIYKGVYIKIELFVVFIVNTLINSEYVYTAKAVHRLAYTKLV